MGKRRVEYEQIEKTIDLGLEKPYHVDLPFACGIRAGKLHGVGARSNQQDSFGISDTSDEAIAKRGLLAIVADGMGGMSGGEKASMTTVISCLNYFDTCGCDDITSAELEEMAHTANEQVREILNGTNGGSTLTAVVIKGDSLYWMSVGDSHIFLFRDGVLTQLNEDHNYAVQLEEMVAQGEISREEADSDPQRDALTSYIGIDSLELIATNAEPITLLSGDRILMSSDGVYNTLSEGDIIEAMDYPVERAMMRMGMQIERTKKKNQDNYTAILLEFDY